MKQVTDINQVDLHLELEEEDVKRVVNHNSS